MKGQPASQQSNKNMTDRPTQHHGPEALRDGSLAERSLDPKSVFCDPNPFSRTSQVSLSRFSLALKWSGCPQMSWDRGLFIEYISQSDSGWWPPVCRSAWLRAHARQHIVLHMSFSMARTHAGRHHSSQMSGCMTGTHARRHSSSHMAGRMLRESDRTQKVNSIDNNKIDELTAKDKATAENTLEADQSANDQNEVSYVNGQGWQFKNYHPNPNVRNNPHLYNYLQLKTPAGNPQNNQGQKAGYQKGYNQNHQGKTYVLSQAQHNQFQNQKQLTNQQVAPAATTAPQDELKSLDMMMQQLLQGQ
ncbi:hypothetical protein F2Q70_00015397 [Brassica cretica]|uniref:Uncharacterized protein n=1 Tax=Brassica cretica TaxID=69181 RepID=A0A8S9HSY2_BRACR|nr:hypothetical protein F2Q70_00015397 [Brassica cretica]